MKFLFVLLFVSASAHAGFYRTSHTPMNSEVPDHITNPTPVSPPVPAPAFPWLMA